MKRPRIKTALISSLCLLAAIVAAFAVYSLVGLRTINENNEEIAENWLPSVQYSEAMDAALAHVQISYKNHILSIDAIRQGEAEQAILAERRNFEAQAARYETFISEDAERVLLADVRAKFDAYVKGGEALLVLSRANRNEEAQALMYAAMEPVAGEIASGIKKIVDLNVAGSKISHDQSQEIFGRIFAISSISVGLCLIMIAAVIVYAFSGVARPIETITASMKKLAGGDTATPIPFAGRADEIGEMAAAVEVFRLNALANRRLEEEAQESRNLSEEERRLKAEADRIRSEEMAQATAGLAGGLKYLAGGDLSFKLEERFAPGYESLRADFNAAVTQLAETLQAVALSTGHIDGGTREISQSAEDLAKRTEQQAASLEETAAALDQITTNVTHSFGRVDEARNVAVQANRSAKHSGEIVTDAIAAMHKIEQSSRQVTNIISVIDEIAFQTNLLALNAGVEAARAGEAGKGFAVVAQEVRELAQRSAQAAKEIKGLISSSSVEVESGVRLVSETGQSLKTIEDYIVAINGHMDAIATSAKEQSIGLAEVNTAVNQMDQVTQQNAAMVEESNAASATLASEAGRLRELIGQFKLGGQTARRPAPMLADQTRHAAVASTPYRLTSQIARAFNGNAAVKESQWEEF